jgi:hypothetical protein
LLKKVNGDKYFETEVVVRVSVMYGVTFSRRQKGKAAGDKRE